MQFDLFINPVVLARKSYPYVINLQSDLLGDTAEQIVAPLIPKAAFGTSPGKLTPTVVVDAVEHVVLIPALSVIRRRDLNHPIASLADTRSTVLAAVDCLFFGV